MNEENKNLIEAFNVLVKNAGKLLIVSFEKPSKDSEHDKRNPAIYKGGCSGNAAVYWNISPDDTRDLLADRLIKAEQLVGQLEVSEARRKEYERNHPDLTQCLANNYHQIKDH